MKVKYLATGAVETVNDCYAMRLNEQGIAVPFHDEEDAEQDEKPKQRKKAADA